MANMNDVASLAGVSRGSVSNYINGRPNRPEIKHKIEQAIRDLNYIPNATARALKTNRSNYVVFILPTVNTPFFSELSYFIQIELNKFGYKMILCNSNSNYQEEIEYIEMANTQKVAGVITMSYSDISELVAPSIPLVAIEKKISNQFPTIVSDNYAGGHLGAEQLHKRGAKKLLFVSKAPIKDVSERRRQGFIDYCQENNLRYDIMLAEDKRDFSSDYDHFIDNHLINGKFQFDGVFSDTDEYASDFWHLLVKHQVLVPKDVQIIGFDAAKIYPRQPIFLSAIRQSTEKMAAIAVQKLLTQFKSEKIDKDNLITILPVSYTQGITTKS